MPGLSSPSPEQLLVFGFLSTKIVKRSAYTNLRFVIQLNGPQGEKNISLKTLYLTVDKKKFGFCKTQIMMPSVMETTTKMEKSSKLHI